jgi:hypothetical protein
MLAVGHASSSWYQPKHVCCAHLCLWAVESQEALPACCCVLDVGHEQAQQRQTASQTLQHDNQQQQPSFWYTYHVLIHGCGLQLEVLKRV